MIPAPPIQRAEKPRANDVTAVVNFAPRDAIAGHAEDGTARVPRAEVKVKEP
jgi:hypothetical protein